LDREVIWRIVRIGIPASISALERSFANLILVKFVSPFGTTAVASHSLIQRVVQFAQMAGMGLGRGAGVLAGQNLGAQQPGRAERTGWTAAGLYTALMAVISLVAFFWAEGIIGLFTSEPETIALSSDFLRIEIAGLMMFGFVAVLMNCLNGVGDTMIPMLNTLLTMWFIQIPLAYFLSNHTSLGVYGIRWGIVTAVVIRAGIYLLYFRSGRWKRKKV
jgi:Na+-driven multidrug efflux pump